MTADECDDGEALEPRGRGGALSSDAFLRELAAAPSIEPERVDLSGQAVAHFQVLRRLGRGGMGVVYEAEDDKLKRKVALKVMPPEVVGDEERRQRFLREARAAAAVTHPHIATVYEIGQEDDMIFIAMELVEGQSLRERLDAAETLDPEEALRIAEAVLRGVRKAHRAGIVHRDLKPDNVMLGADGEVKVLDFGLAKLRASEGRAAEDDAADGDAAAGEAPASTGAVTTEEGRVMGTPGYMSPEQATGKPVDPRSDLFAIGVILYEMTCGVRPFTGDSSMEVIVATTRDEPVPPSAVREAIGPPLDELILRALAKAPEDRYADASAMLEAIATVQEALAVAPASGQQGASRTPIYLLAGVIALGAAYALWSAGPETASSASPASTAAGNAPASAPATAAVNREASGAEPTEAPSEPPAPDPAPEPTGLRRPEAERRAAASATATPPPAPRPVTTPRPKPVTPPPTPEPTARPKVNLGI